jgi:dTDP-4-amino-4,6-dideoxygalactose transaminase
MQCVLLRAGLQRLPEQTRLREENVQYIRESLDAMGGPLRAAKRDPRVTRQAYYTMTLRFDPAQAQGVTRDQYLAALQAEKASFGGTYAPVYRNPLLNLYDRTSPIPFRDASRTQNYATLRLPETERAVAETAVLLSHTHLLGSREYIDQLLAAVAKVNAGLDAVRAHAAAKKA